MISDPVLLMKKLLPWLHFFADNLFYSHWTIVAFSFLSWKVCYFTKKRLHIVHQYPSYLPGFWRPMCVVDRTQRWTGLYLSAWIQVPWLSGPAMSPALVHRTADDLKASRDLKKPVHWQLHSVNNAAIGLFCCCWHMNLQTQTTVWWLSRQQTGGGWWG